MLFSLFSTGSPWAAAVLEVFPRWEDVCYGVRGWYYTLVEDRPVKGAALSNLTGLTLFLCDRTLTIPY